MITEFGKELQKLRIDLEISQKEMAESLGLTPSKLSAIESGRSPIPLDTADRLLGIHGHVVDKERLEAAFAESTTSITIDLTDMEVERKRVAIQFARTFPDTKVMEVSEVILGEDGSRSEIKVHKTNKPNNPQTGNIGRAVSSSDAPPSDDPVYDQVTTNV